MSQAKNNPFNPFEAWTQNLNQNWSQPNPNAMENMRDQANKNIQAASALGQMCTESFQAMAKRANDVAQKNMQTATQCFQASLGCKTMEDAQKNQSESLNKMNKECSSNAKEMTEMSQDLARRCIDACDSMSQDAMKSWESQKPASKK